MIDSIHKKKFYITTPIYYVNAAPHLGSLYSTLLADVATRYHALMGKDTFFLTGTDEHGQKIAEAAKKAGKEPREFIEQFVQEFKNVWSLYNINYTKFIRTTDADHVVGVQTWLSNLIAQGDIYKGVYTGWYCTPCETFVTEKDQSADAKEVTCPNCLRPTNQISEECYYFRLSAYQDKLLKFFEQHPDFITPKERLHEVISFVQEGLKDLSISRTTVTWGIPFPGDSKHVTYVWADALNNYITAVGYGNTARQKDLAYWWPADVQILGKDILRFHAVYWLAFLMASGLQLPKQLLVHGWIKMGDQKMSKSLGNAIDPKSLAQQYGVDEIRFYLMSKMAITQDSPFSVADIEQSINAQLANDLGNLLNRCATLAEKFSATTLQSPDQWSLASQKLRQNCDDMVQESLELIEQGFAYRAVHKIYDFIGAVNSYFHAHEPWKLASKDVQQFQEVMAATMYSLRVIGVMLWPIMPIKMEKLLASLNFNLAQKLQKSHDIFASLKWTDAITMNKIEPLFQKFEKVAMESKNNSEVVAPVEQSSLISIDDFVKVDLRVGLIVQCEIVEKSDKLYKLQVDFGSQLGKRQIFTGLRKFLQPEDLLGKQGVFVVNFKPRMIMGMPSEGMMLSADSGDGIVVALHPAKEIALGAKVK